jgi:hypothetical protein
VFLGFVFSNKAKSCASLSGISTEEFSTLIFFIFIFLGGLGLGRVVKCASILKMVRIPAVAVN